ncbi:hypothetical protein FHU36_001461 [Nonomuraea muscovyensis]|uniref:Uncharacterized protein n=1 Tax=Nonomuraea muscovyensis TaxID=1124761 RepID=A0A7X0BXX2_9ACTN|nr:hypothetical protein [Nonomuraea muscovyensis]MBB6344952.1 hypothetical protein [Nonomuraea muscovyensis]
MIGRGWVVAGTMVAAGVPVLPVAAAAMTPVPDRVDDQDTPGSWARTGDELRFRVRLAGPGRAARLALAAGPAPALTSVTCVPVTVPAGDAAGTGGSAVLSFHALASGGAAEAVRTVPPSSPVAEGGAAAEAGTDVPAASEAGAAPVPAGVRSAMRRAFAAVESPRPVAAGRASACDLGDVHGWREVDVRLAAPLGAREVVLAAVARMRDGEGGGVTVVSRVAVLPVTHSPAEAAPGEDWSAGQVTGATAGDAGVAAGEADATAGDAGVAAGGVGVGEAGPGGGAPASAWQGRVHKHRGAFALRGQATRLPRGRGARAGGQDGGVQDGGTQSGRAQDGRAQDGRAQDGGAQGGRAQGGGDGAVAGVDGRPWGARGGRRGPGSGAYTAPGRQLMAAPHVDGAAPVQESGDGPSFPAATPAPLMMPPQAPVAVPTAGAQFPGSQAGGGFAGNVAGGQVSGSVDGGLGAPLPRQVAVAAARPERSEPVNVLAGPQGVAVAGGGIAVLLGALWGVARAQQARIRRKVR